MVMCQKKGSSVGRKQAGAEQWYVQTAIKGQKGKEYDGHMEDAKF